jgi:hypothetical protein
MGLIVWCLVILISGYPSTVLLGDIRQSFKIIEMLLL